MPNCGERLLGEIDFPSLSPNCKSHFFKEGEIGGHFRSPFTYGGQTEWNSHFLTKKNDNTTQHHVTMVQVTQRRQGGGGGSTTTRNAVVVSSSKSNGNKQRGGLVVVNAVKAILLVAAIGILLSNTLPQSSYPSSSSSSPSSSMIITDSLEIQKQRLNKKQHSKKHQLHGYTGEVIELRSSYMPSIGYGTCCRKGSNGKLLYDSTLIYLKYGGRLIDTAMMYRNHETIGTAIRDSGLKRNEIWITSKINPSNIKIRQGNNIPIQNQTITFVKQIINELNIGSDGDPTNDYIDLCLIHSPQLGKIHTIEIWKGLIESQRLGLIKSIGVSNFNQQEMLDLANNTGGVLPELNQIQYHPWTSPTWKQLVMWQKQHHIATTAFTSLGGSKYHTTLASTSKAKNQKDGGGGASSSSYWPPLVTKLATKYSVTESQVLLRWATQQGVAVIPGSSSEPHIRENLLLQATNFKLSQEERQQLESSPPPNSWFDPKLGPVKYVDDGDDTNPNNSWKSHDIPKK